MSWCAAVGAEPGGEQGVWTPIDQTRVAQTVRIAYKLEFWPPGVKPEPPKKLRAVPRVAATVVRGESLVLDGSQSTGDIRSYRWTFQPLPDSTGLSPPRADAAKEGDVARVILLDSMKVTLTVSDGKRTHSKTVSVKVVPRNGFLTAAHHHSENRVGVWESAPAPELRASGHGTGASNLAEATFRNDCELDPNQSPSHVVHPDLTRGNRSEYFTVAALEDPDGPFDGYFYVKDWKVKKIQRKTMISRWPVPSGPPLVAGQPNWFDHNGKTRAVAYLRGADKAARLQTSKMDEFLTNQYMNGTDPGSWAESSYGMDEGRLKDEVMLKLVKLESSLRAFLAFKADSFFGVVEVWDPDKGQWRIVTVSL